jgi:hypothetical protein
VDWDTPAIGVINRNTKSDVKKDFAINLDSLLKLEAHRDILLYAKGL